MSETLSLLYFNKILLHKSSEWSSLVTDPRFNFSPPEVKNPGIFHGSATTFHYKQLYGNKLDNWEEMDKFLGTYSPPKLNKEEIDNLNRTITRSEIESLKQTTCCKQKFRLHWGILPNIQRRIYIETSQTLPKDCRVFLWSHHHPDTKTKQRHYGQKKLQANIFMNIDTKIINKILSNWIQ